MEKESANCLNCGTVLKASFCENCGQKSSTKRFNISQLITSDFLVSFFSLEKGFLFTLKSLFTKPGHLVREYIEGKRNTYFHFLTFLLIILAISVFISEFSNIGMADLFDTSEQSKKFMLAIETFGKSNPRLVMLLQIPVYAIMSFLWFLKAKQNFAEHIILNTYKASGELIIAILFTIITIFYTNTSVLTYIYNIFIYGLMLIFVGILYYQYFKPYYQNTFKFILRIIFCMITAQVLVGILISLTAVIQIIIDGNFEEFMKSMTPKS